MEFLDVVERDRFEALGRSDVGMAVRVVLVELGLQRPLAQRLVVISAQALGHVVDRLIAEPLEVRGVEPGLGDHLGRDRECRPACCRDE